MTAKRAKAGAPGREQEQARAPGQERGQAPERARGPGQARGQMTEQAPAPARGQTTEQAPAPAPEQARAAASDGLRPAYAQRLADFRRRLAALELDGFLVGREENLYY
ncbi:MAG: hypothetical protein LBK98_02205, partial [Peptococcaceae bacterium]|nr:hypothetical protein [Peptococcaceae bacterium]